MFHLSSLSGFTFRLSLGLCALLMSAMLAAAPMAKVDINTATSKQLADNLSGISVVKAELIVSYRQKNGPFKRVDDIVLVKGIGVKTLQKLRDQLTVTSQSLPAETSN